MKESIGLATGTLNTEKECDDRVINIFSDIDDDMASSILKQIFKIKKEDDEIIKENKKMASIKDHKELEPVIVNIMTWGGYVTCVCAIHDALKTLDCKVITKGYGVCSSGGFYLLFAGTERLAGKNTSFLYHTMLGACFGRLKDMKDSVEHNEAMQNKLDAMVLADTKITKEVLNEKHRQDWWLTYEEALELGIIHGEIK